MEYHEESYIIDDLVVNCEMTPKMLSESLGDEDIQPKTHLESDKNRFHGIYRGILVSNPNTIFLKEGASSLTLFKTNVRA